MSRGRGGGTLLVTGGTVVTPGGLVADGHVAVRDGRIVSVGEGPGPDLPGAAARIDAAGGFVAPGFIDLHVHGGGGGDALDGTDGALTALARLHAEHGTTALLPTIMTAPPDAMRRATEALARRMALADERPPGRATAPDGAELLGVHLEGPALARSQRGAHAAQHLTTPDAQVLLECLSPVVGVRRVTLAPELPGAIAAVRTLAEAGVLVSLGHSDATLADVEAAVRAGATQVTHLYSCTSSVRNVGGEKVPGLVEAALLLDELAVEIIADGHHLPPALVALVLRAKGAERVFAVTDAIRAAGLGPGRYELGGAPAVVAGGVARTSDGARFAGSVATMDVCLRFLCGPCGLELPLASRLLSLNPARVSGVDEELGTLEVGKAGSLVVLDRDLRPRATAVRGRPLARPPPARPGP